MPRVIKDSGSIHFDRTENRSCIQYTLYGLLVALAWGPSINLLIHLISKPSKSTSYSLNFLNRCIAFVCHLLLFFAIIRIFSISYNYGAQETIDKAFLCELSKDINENFWYLYVGAAIGAFLTTVILAQHCNAGDSSCSESSISNNCDTIIRIPFTKKQDNKKYLKKNLFLLMAYTALGIIVTTLVFMKGGALRDCNGLLAVITYIRSVQ